MTNHGPPEKVYAEHEWYDGPRAGVADIGGTPHRFKSLFDEKDDEYLGTFLVWPVEPEVVALEQEQWRIFAEWNALHDAGEAGTESHPGHGGKSQRWDEIELLLKAARVEAPASARRAVAKLIHPADQVRHASSSPAYLLSWRLL